MLALGRLYMQGLGVPQDYVEAHQWLNLAASRGEVEAAQERDALAEKMTPQQVATAQGRAASWQPGTAATPPGGVTDNRALLRRRSTSQLAAAEAGEALEANEVPTPTPAVGVPPQTIREAQVLLARMGYDPGPADGQWGARTARAYGEFLRDSGLPSAETLTPAELIAMRAEANRRQENSGIAAVRPPPLGLGGDRARRADGSISSSDHGRAHRRRSEHREPSPE